MESSQPNFQPELERRKQSEQLGANTGHLKLAKQGSRSHLRALSHSQVRVTANQIATERAIEGSSRFHTKNEAVLTDGSQASSYLALRPLQKRNHVRPVILQEDQAMDS